MLIRYSRWDGTQSLPDFDADDLLDQMADDVLADGDPRRALQLMLQRGFQGEKGKMPGLRDLLEQLRRRRQQQLERYDLGSSLEDIKKKLEEIVQQERQGMPERVPAGRERKRREEALDKLPPDPAGKIRDLQKYDFADPGAKQKFEELLASLRQQMLQPFFGQMEKSLKNMTPEDLKRMREMIQDLNRMLRERAEGREPDFEQFKQKWGQQFPGA